jgi:MFS family permease
MRGPSFAVLRHRDFTLYTVSSFLWTIAMQVQATALAWQIYEMTHDPFKLGLVGLMEFLPAAVLALPAGHLADRYDRRRIILVGVAGELTMAAVLVVLAALHRVSVPAILLVALLFGIARAVATPAARALMPNLMPKEDLPRAVAWSSTSWQVATICGPGLGGLLYAWSPVMAYGATTLGLIGAAAAIVVMRGRAVAPPASRDSAADRDLASVLGGLALIFRNKLLLGAISLDLFAVLFSGATARSSRSLPGYPGGWRRRRRAAAQCAGTGRRHGGPADPARPAPCRRAAVHGGRRLRRGGRGLRPVAVLLALVPGRARARRRRHGQRLHPRNIGAVGNARCPPRPRGRRRGGLHRRLQ